MLLYGSIAEGLAWLQASSEDPAGAVVTAAVLGPGDDDEPDDDTT